MKPAFLDLKVYDAFEVHPVHALDAEGNPIPARNFTTVAVVDLEQCEEDDLDIFCWSVYGHIPHTKQHDKGGLFCLIDCPTKQIAEFIAWLLMEEREIQHAKAWNKKQEERAVSANNSGYR